MVLDLVLKLVDRLIQLTVQQKQQRRELLRDFVDPAWNEFEKVHAAYLSSFAQYESLLRRTEDPNWIAALQERLRTDNLYTADQRARVRRLADVSEDPLLGSFVGGLRDYIFSARLVQPLGREAQPHAVQRWRQGLIDTLGYIAGQDWQLVIDPNGARPPMSPVEIDAEVAEIGRRHGISASEPERAERIKRAFALEALQAIVIEMQGQYDTVLQAYTDLRARLLQ